MYLPQTLIKSGLIFDDFSVLMKWVLDICSVHNLLAEGRMAEDQDRPCSLNQRQ